MKTIKKLTAVLLAILFVFSPLAGVPFELPVFAATSGTTGDCTWSLSGTTLTISGSGKMRNYSSGGPWGFGITKVIIEDGVTTIGDWAFWDCDSLISITIPDSVTTIGDLAFYGCRSLTSVTIGDSVTSIGATAFSGCRSLTSITIPDSVTSIGDDAFDRCYSLTSVTIGDSVTSIGSSAFRACSSLTSVTIGDSVTSIGNYAFSGCTSLTSINIPDSVTSIGTQAFYNCSSLTSITIPDSVTSIGKYAFYNCSKLTSVIIPDSVTSIGGEAFSGCKSLTDVWYEGSEADRARISIGEDNGDLTSATWHYNFCIKNPATEKVHVYDNACDTDCNVCGNVRTPSAHVYDNPCEDPDCNECGFIRTPQHYIQIFVTPHTEQNSSSYPFTQSGGWYCSSNHSNSSSSTYTVTATHDCSLVIYYKVSSESGYDVFTVKKNSTQLDQISGSVSEKTKTVSLVEGDTLTFTYSKDSSRSSGSDCGWFKIECNCLVGNVPCDELEPTCTQAVICSGCHLEIKPVIPHTYDNACDADCNVCGQTRTPSDHVYDGVCDTDCNVCGEDRTPPHDYTVRDKNTTYHWLKCSLCGRVNESTRASHAYDNACDDSCNGCDFKRIPPHVFDSASDYECNLCLIRRPAAPKSESVVGTTVTLETVEGCEYSADGFTWQASPVFEDLDPVTVYTFYQRYAETAVYYASAASLGTKVTTKKATPSAPAAPTAEEITKTSVTLVKEEGMQYSLDGTTWKTSSVFTGLRRGGVYTFYVRYGETSTHYASPASEALEVQTLKDPQLAPKAPTLVKVTGASVTLFAAEGIEYSMDGENWQSEAVFRGLAPDTEYTFYQRQAEKDEYYASPASEGLVVKTLSVTPGDLDGNPGVDMDDAIYLLFHTSFPEDYPLNQDANFDGVGEVDMDDAIYLLFYTSFPEDYPLTR